MPEWLTTTLSFFIVTASCTEVFGGWQILMLLWLPRCCLWFTDTSNINPVPTPRLSPITTSSTRVPRWNHYQYILQFRLIPVTCAALNLCTNQRQNNTAALCYRCTFCFTGFLDRWVLLVVQSQHEQESHNSTLKCIVLAYSSDNSRWQAGLHNVCECERDIWRDLKWGEV